jgi:hypothetical protein
MILETKAGPLTGQQISVPVGQPLLIGRAADRAQFAVPPDNLMSGVHFAVECGPDGCRVIDKNSTNGTYLNGAKIREPMLLANGDEIKSGQTVFVVRMVPDNPPSRLFSNQQAVGQSPGTPPRPALVAPTNTPSPIPATAAARTTAPPLSGKPPALMIGSWTFHKIPEDWQIQEGLGIQQKIKDAFPASIGATEEPLGPGTTLPIFVEAHSKMFRESLPDSRIETVAAPAVSGSEETAAVEIHFTIKGGPAACFHRLYVRNGSTIGVLTLTLLEKDLAAIRPAFDSAVSTISFFVKV